MVIFRFPFMAPVRKDLFNPTPLHRKDVNKNIITGEILETVYGLFPRLYERRKQWGKLLSCGEQQMLAVGRALMTGSEFIMLDEPSMGWRQN